jgi:oligoribonuclease NrnB/cAMP/cGMP phosphodiesterase (DHH superfamily)
MDLILYHKNCPDGFCAAFIAKKVYPEATLVGLTWGEPAPIVAEGMKVLMLDFCYPREVSIALHKKVGTSGSFYIIDHHATAQEAVKGLPFAYFDMKRSGAGLTWDLLMEGKRPWYVEYVEDRDLWNKALPDTDIINAFIMSLPYTLDAWQSLDNICLSAAKGYGAVVHSYLQQYINKVVAEHQVGTFWGHPCTIVNAAYPNVSEVLHELMHREHVEIGISYFERRDALIQFSLRSIGDVNVGEIAKEYGGGGHKNTAGFEQSYVQGRYLVDQVLQRLPGKKYPFNPSSRGQAGQG